jgi:hypothetical protein
MKNAIAGLVYGLFTMQVVAAPQPRLWCANHAQSALRNEIRSILHAQFHSLNPARRRYLYAESATLIKREKQILSALV